MIIKMKTENIKIKTNPKFNDNYYSKLSQCKMTLVQNCILLGYLCVCVCV